MKDTQQFVGGVSQIALTVGLAIVRKSVDPQFKRWAVIYPTQATRWFKSEEAAEQAKKDYNEGRCDSRL